MLTRRTYSKPEESLSGRPPRGSLPHVLLLSLVNLIPLAGVASGAVTAVIALCCSCGRASTETSPQPDPTPTPTDSLLSFINISASYPIKNLDLFVYADSWTRLLDRHYNLQNLHPTSTTILTLPGDKRLVIIANSPYEFNIEALRAFDSIELLEMNYADEDPDYPLMSAFEVFTAGDSVKVELTPMLCPVEILEVQNCLEDTPLLQNPRVRLTNINAKAELLRFSGFHPTDIIESPDEIGHPKMMSQHLPSDIGLYTQHPGTTLYCYPITSPNNDIAAVHTTLIFEAEIATPDGQRETLTREWPLPTIPRGTTTALSLCIE